MHPPDRCGAPASGIRFALAALLLLVVGFVATPALAHTVGVSRGEYRRVPEGLRASLTFARSELLVFGNERRAVDRIAVRGAAPCSAELTKIVSLEADGVEIEALFRCRDAGPIRLSLAPLFPELTRGHRHEATALPSGASTLLFESQPELVVEKEASAPAGAPEVEAHAASVLGFVRLGIEHILTGYDHLVFLLGLVIVGLGIQRTIVVASAFTLAHSVSLAVSVLGSWTPPSSVVEPAIALSIVYVGIENLVATRHERRTGLAFAFGLVHGFGFASALSSVRFRGLELFGALLGFNAGVELGQLLVLALFLPLVGVTLARPAFARYALPAVSVLVAASGAVWFALRIYALA
jgi:hypothetical protein